MNFFEQQAKAQKRTGKLLLLFTLAVVLLIIATTLALEFTLHLMGGNKGTFVDSLSLETFALVGIIITGVVLICATIKQWQLRRGGPAVAEMLNATRINRSTQDIYERRLLNVVDEMALASGIPSPPIYVMEESSINAFAAGHSPRDAAIGITRGAMTLLSRDELQGVIAHEFSHIFNGDMRLNIRLLGWLHGILVIGICGRLILEGSARSGAHYRTSSSNENRAGGAAAILLFGLALVVIGWIGSAVGHWIRSAVSRQREFLADATAVKYTRNPEGIGGALLKIGGLPNGSILMHPRADEMEHFFINQCHSKSYGSFSSHPPLDQRIKAIMPRWDGKFPKVEVAQLRRNFDAINPNNVHLINGQVYIIDSEKKPLPQSITDHRITAHHMLGLVDSIGAPTQAHIDIAKQTRKAIPKSLRVLAGSANGAQSILHALFASHNPTHLIEHAELLQRASREHGVLLQYSDNLVDEVRQILPSQRLPLVDLCLPSLTGLNRPQLELLIDLLEQQINVDHEVTLLEWSLLRVIRVHLLPTSQLLPASGKMHTKAAHTVIQALAHYAHSEQTEREHAYQHAATLLQLEAADELSVPSWRELDRALGLLRSYPALKKPVLLRAFCAAIAQDDQSYTLEMVEALRAIADTLDCPMPPVISTDVNTNYDSFRHRSPSR